MNERKFIGDINDTNTSNKQSNLNDSLNNVDDGMMADAVHISEEFVRSGYTFKTPATQPENESGNNNSATTITG